MGCPATPTGSAGPPSGEAPGEDLGHELLDAGNGRKLERFGAAVIVRPAPAARGMTALGAGAWEEAWAEYARGGRGGGEWRIRRPLPEPWIARSAGMEHLLEPTPAGQVGLFPEQARLRERLGEIIRRAAAGVVGPPRVLDLFGSTGGSTLTAAAAGGAVTLVDASRGALGRARRNLARNGLGEAPVRSIAEHVPRFVARELRRGARYDAVVLDPPSFGRGPRGEIWKIEKDIDDLLAACRLLLTGESLLLMLSAHTASWEAADLAARVDRALTGLPGATESGSLALPFAGDRELPSGHFALRELR